MHAAGARRLKVNEDGFATIAVIGIMAVSLAFAGVAAIASMTTLRGSVRDEDSKLSLAAADAGAAAALAHQNSIAASNANPCLAPGVGGTLVSTSANPDGWCPAVTGSVDGGTYSYQVNSSPDGELTVVSVGTSDGVSRRIELTAQDSAGSNVFSEASLMGLDSIHMDSNAAVNGDAATNGSMALNSNARLCGSASVGVGEEFTVSGNANHGGPGCPQSTYPVMEGPLTLAPVQQGDVATNNSNGRMFTPGSCSGADCDLIGGNANKVDWDPVNRRLELGSNVSITLGGTNYSFCQVKLSSNSTIYIAQGANVSMFFDAPENCGGEQAPLQMHSNSKIIATGGVTTKVAMLFVGSDTLPTTIELSSNSMPSGDCSSGFVIYAPKTHIDVNSNVTYCGAMAGKSINLDSNSTIESGSEVPNFQLPGAGPHYTPNRFVECTSTTTGTTGQGC